MKARSLALLFVAVTVPLAAQTHGVFSDYRNQAPAVTHRIRPSDLPPARTEASAENGPVAVPRPPGAWPKAPPGFKVDLYASGFDYPRALRTAPNGDLFLAESNLGQIKVLRGLTTRHEVAKTSVFCQNLGHPFGMAFFPPGPDPKWLYVSNDQFVYRFPYRQGALVTTGARQTIAELSKGGHLRGGGHWTRDLAFSNNGKKLYVSVGSMSNDDDPDTHPTEFQRADVLEMNPDGSGRRVYVSGVRNAVGLAIHPASGELWGSTNERDGLGDNVPPDYITHFQAGGFYGWPYFYAGGIQDPRHRGQHPELQARTLQPDVLVQAHNASLQLTFYQGSQFPREFRGDIFAAQHGSWNRSVRTGYEVIRVPMHGKTRSPGGEYQDFLTGFVTADGRVWGRPVGVAVARDGALMVSDDESRSVWRVAWVGK